MQRFDPGMPHNKALFPVMQVHQQQTFLMIPHYHTSFVNYNMIPVQQTPFNVPVKPAPSLIESLGSPQMSSTLIPLEDSNKAEPVENLTISHSVDGTNNGNQSGNLFSTYF